MRATLLAVTALTFALSPAPAAAQALFTPPGDVALTPLAPSLEAAGRVLGVDAEGWVYTLETGGLTSLSFWHPDDPAGTLGSVHFPSAALLAGFTWDHGAALIVERATDGATMGYRVYHLRAADHAGQQLVPPPAPVGYWSEIDSPALLGDVAWGMADKPLRASPSGVVCLPLTPALVCIDTTKAGPAAVNTLLEYDTLGDRIPVSPAWEAPVMLDGEPPTSRHWQLVHATPAADGRVFAHVQHGLIHEKPQPRTSPTVGLDYLLALDLDGGLTIRFGPIPVDGYGPLDDASHLVYSGALDAIVTPVAGGDPGWDHTTTEYAAFFGHGLRVFPVSAPGVGYLSLASAVARYRVHPPEHFGQPPWPVAVKALSAPDGALSILLDHTGFPVPEAVRLYALTFDPAALDLDADLLTAAEEAALGTSDTLADSDGSGTLDGVESRLAGTDPADAADDPASAVELQRETTYALSPLVHRVLPDIPDSGGYPQLFPATARGLGAPLCLDGTCYAPGGAVVMTYPAEDETLWPSSVVSADGRFIATWTSAGLVRTWFEDGRRERYIPQEHILAAIAVPQDVHGVVEPFPIDARRTFLVKGSDASHHDLRPQVVFCETGSPCEKVFDLETARCDSGLGPCDAGPAPERAPDDLTPAPSFELLGWDPVTKRLLIQVKGKLDGWLVGVHEREPPLVIERAATMGGLNGGVTRFGPYPAPGPAIRFPAWQVPTGRGDFLTDQGLVTPYRSYLSTRFQEYDGGEPSLVWDDTLLRTICCGTTLDGTYEVVRLEHRLDPGDVVMVRPQIGPVPYGGGIVGAMLYKSGPRGGLAPLWRAPNPAIARPGDIDVTADGRLCVPDQERGQLWLFEPSSPSLRVPDFVSETVAVGDIVGCLFDGDDVLVLTQTDVLRYAPGSGELVHELTPELLGEPFDLLRRPDGEVEVVSDPDLRGKAYGGDGQPLTVAWGDFSLRRGETEAAQARWLVYVGPTLAPPSDWPARVRMVERPDGFVFLVAFDAEFFSPTMSVGRLYAWDTHDDVVRAASLDEHDASEGIGLALVPGGSSADPWTFTAGAAAHEPTDPTTPAPPAAPTDGEPIPGEGCQGGASPLSGVAGALSALALALLRRRRARL
jgi:hypothetical protein